MKTPPSVPRIEALKIKNYRALHDLELKDITPYTVFLGPNGSGKSTIFDVFAFLSECFQSGLKGAWGRRGKFKELRTRGVPKDEKIVIELKYREARGQPIITYHLAISEDKKSNPIVSEEWLQWRRQGRGRPFKFLDFQDGKGEVISGENPDESDERISESLSSPDMLAVSTLGQFAKHPRVSALRQFITDWSLSYLSVNEVRKIHDSGPQDRLSESGDNLANVIQYLSESEPEELAKILGKLSSRVPRLDSVESEFMSDGTLCLMFKDIPFEEPVIAKYVSDGTLRLLAYLVLLYSPKSPKLIGVEEPENQLHPRLLEQLAEEFRIASAHTQIFVTTHSPYFVNELSPKEVRVLYRDEKGFTHAVCVSDMESAMAFLREGAKIGALWMEGILTVGDPLINAGGPKKTIQTPLFKE
ncbi:MAG: AAA family ATPase [Methanocorpusculum sp.]|uniref:AAA family ATPase n=1 Tax=Methanocorpusculum sp. TaxID=2058474 RepID=UPI002A904528|nr:AAA family ATPase [Methanocorpusculum sp.]MDY3203366.1 AAA family ATPase [Methanocorpusculum sp.]MEA5087065.1 AAA family ATPase [Methanocorpusculum sp.]